MKLSIVAGALLIGLSNFVTVVSADTCSGAYFTNLIPAPADCHRRTQKNDTVTVHYKGYFPNGTVFDQTDNSTGPFVYQYGVGQVITGFDEGLAHMCVGQKRWVMIPPKYGYGNESVGGGLIPPNSTLIFDITLNKIQAPAK